MTGLNPASSFLRRWSAGLAAFSLILVRLTAQPLALFPTNDPGTNAFTLTNPIAPPLVTTSTGTSFSSPTKLERYDFIQASARFQANTHAYADAEKNFVKLLAEDVPEVTRQTALVELAQVVRSENDLPRAQAIYTQYLQRWPGDSRTPEIYLRQGQVFREMGLPNMALAKFYGVMTTALSLKDNQMTYYKGLVLQAQVEIAETHYLAGQFKDAVDYYSRLLTQNDPALDRAQIQFRLIRSLEAINRHAEAVSQAQDFLAHFPESLEAAEVRYHLAQAYKGQNRNTEALQQVKIFLQEEHDQTTNNPAIWAYWQERVGNEIGNELYQEGDYVKALQVYLALSQLDAAPAWQLPVRYQVGITYEKLLQPRLAIEVYRNLLTNAVPSLGTNLTPNLKAVTEMAAWRLHFLEWNERADSFNHPTGTATNLSLNQP
jgi:tetratricopeptide (TPR) repeat protein